MTVWYPNSARSTTPVWRPCEVSRESASAVQEMGNLKFYVEQAWQDGNMHYSRLLEIPGARERYAELQEIAFRREMEYCALP